MDAQRGIARRMVIGIPRDGLSPAWEKDFAAYPPAGVILFRRDFRDLDDLRRLTRRLRELAQPRRLFVTIDEEGGFVSQLGGLLVVPPAAGLLGRGAGPGDLEYVSRITGERLRAVGVDWVFAPVADIHSERRNPVIGPRAYGRTADEVSTRIGEVLRGFRAAGIAACLKHFPGHGDTLLDSHVALPRLDVDDATLERRELVPFRAHAGADAVMSAHVVVSAWDADRPATFSRAAVTHALRERIGFTGVCITDALEMRGAAEGHGPAETGRLALEAGCDLLLYATWDESLRTARLELARMLASGAIDRTNFDAARPRLAALDARSREPSADELERPLERLTPADWDARLAAIVERGLEVRGTLPAGAAGPWSVREPAVAYGPSLADELAARGITVRRTRHRRRRRSRRGDRLPRAARSPMTSSGSPVRAASAPPRSWRSRPTTSSTRSRTPPFGSPPTTRRRSPGGIVAGRLAASVAARA
jgi:beta-N-acetylhexosaminidase